MNRKAFFMTVGNVRDTQLDAYRALTMIYIVCVLHVLQLYLGATNKYFMIFLWEMPAIFFIAGASMQYANEKSFKDTIVNRSYRVLIPYWIYLATTQIIYRLFDFFVGRVFPLPITIWGVKDLLMAFLGVNTRGIEFGHLWFVFPYMAISCIFPLIRQLVLLYTWKFVLLNTVLLVFVNNLAFFCNSDGPMGWALYVAQEFIGYMVFFVIGFLYYKNLSRRKCFYIIITTLLLFQSMTFCILPNMQAHKFPPDSLFIVYGIFTLSAWGLLLTKISIPASKILSIWNKKGYTLYLYQSWGVLIVFSFKNKFQAYFSDNAIWLVSIISSIFFVFILNTIISKYTYAFEREIISRIHN